MVKSDRNRSECALISRRMDGACHEGDDSHAAQRIRERGLTCCSHPPAHQPRRSKSLHSTDGLHSNVAAFCWTSWIHSRGVFPTQSFFFLSRERVSVKRGYYSADWNARGQPDGTEPLQELDFTQDFP